MTLIHTPMGSRKIVSPSCEGTGEGPDYVYVGAKKPIMTRSLNPQFLTLLVEIFFLCQESNPVPLLHRGLVSTGAAGAFAPVDI